MRQRHSLSKSIEWKKWRSMVSRVRYPSPVEKRSYSHVVICDRWNYFVNFYEDMGPCPANHELDRIDTTKGYSKENCRWTMKTVNCFNKRKQGVNGLPIGVSRRPSGKYRTMISIEKIRYNLGTFPTQEEASEAYNTVAKEWYGFTTNT